MIPLIVIGALLAVAGAVKIGTHTSPSRELSAGDDLPSPTPKAIHLLVKIIKLGKEPPEWLINEAVCDAYDAGDFKLVGKLHRMFGESELDTPIPSDEVESPDTMTVSGKSSPLDGVDNQAWQDFVERLSTDKPDFASERHVGKYHHSRDRLKQLGIDDVSTEDAQYEALVKDLEDARGQSQDLIREYLATEVTIMSETYPVTLSGILGLLKAAGVRNARNWLASDKDRTDHPQTTKIFLSTNGVF